ncbi:Mediator of RNA polymerase II transcription subunit 4 [Rhynchospora pubera]|uniref:Mediator of RNA polymerase II transcription subunit 4 n=1 Tax=Rhynchospora pubera TaxID=906938 RepID=A0AAV8E792_9POAL|nr:Mediator of RNA polymerase II transcription subunit 4 [Rhynchospora pubera]
MFALTIFLHWSKFIRLLRHHLPRIRGRSHSPHNNRKTQSNPLYVHVQNTLFYSSSSAITNHHDHRAAELSPAQTIAIERSKTMQSHGAQILPSPARLGLTTSHSPSLSGTNVSTPIPNPSPLPSNPNPKSTPSLSPLPASIAATSPSLLPLLPPLPRAQTLLLHMSHLASKLFDLSSNRSAWLSSYRGTFPSFPPSSNSPAPSPSLAIPTSFKDLLSQFTSLQTQLFEAVAELQEILDLQDSQKKISREIRAKDATLLSFTKKICEAHHVLDQLTEDYSGSLDTIHSSLDLQDILAYAHRISYTTFAPPEHGAGLAPLRGALPPAPQDNEMRASQLYNFADLDVGVPAKKLKPTDTKERVPNSGTDSPLMISTPQREEPVPPMPFQPPHLPIAVSPGWLNGLPPNFPAEHPLILPPMPAGWKPGDSINLDGLENMFAGQVSGSQPPSMPLPVSQHVEPKAQGTAPAPAVIHVPDVQLDIGDDDNSEYSSDVDSSEEDDED